MTNNEKVEFIWAHEYTYNHFVVGDRTITQLRPLKRTIKRVGTRCIYSIPTPYRSNPIGSGLYTWTCFGTPAKYQVIEHLNKQCGLEYILLSDSEISHLGLPELCNMFNQWQSIGEHDKYMHSLNMHLTNHNTIVKSSDISDLSSVLGINSTHALYESYFTNGVKSCRSDIALYSVSEGKVESSIQIEVKTRGNQGIDQCIAYKPWATEVYLLIPIIYTLDTAFINDAQNHGIGILSMDDLGKLYKLKAAQTMSLAAGRSSELMNLINKNSWRTQMKFAS